jgi:hypothetical protein
MKINKVLNCSSSIYSWNLYDYTSNITTLATSFQLLLTSFQLLWSLLLLLLYKSKGVKDIKQTTSFFLVKMICVMQKG